MSRESRAALDSRRWTLQMDSPKLPRSLTRAKATVILEDDPMRTGCPAQIYDLAISRLGLQMESPPEVGEMIKVRLENEIQRIEREVRGIVREVTAIGDHLCRVRIELFVRLTPRDVLLLKSPFSDDDVEDGSLWI